jgi:hypothetical protein
MRAPSPAISHKILPAAVGAVLLLTLLGCTSVDVESRPGPSGETRIHISVYPTQHDLEERRSGPYGVLTELEQWTDGEWRQIKVSMLPVWGMENAAPGKYRVRAERRVSEAGHIEKLKGRTVKEFKVTAGRDSEVRVILEGRPPTGLIVTGVLVGAAVIWALTDKGHHLPDLPPLPPFTPGVHSAVAMDVFINFGALGPPVDGYRRAEAPRLIANFPLHKDPHAAPDTHIFLNFSEPVKSDWDDEVLQVLGDTSGRMPGRLVFHPGGDMVEFIPDGPFRPGEHVTVTLDGAGVEGRWNNGMEGKVSFEFRVHGDASAEADRASDPD